MQALLAAPGLLPDAPARRWVPLSVEIRYQ
jgi:hypothetical protein